MKNSLSIKRLPKKIPKTSRYFTPQKPSWIRAEMVVRNRTTKKITMCRIARAKLTLIMADGPKQALPPSDAEGHCS